MVALQPLLLSLLPVLAALPSGTAGTAAAKHLEISGAGALDLAVNGAYYLTGETANGRPAYRQDSGRLWLCTDAEGLWSVQTAAQSGERLMAGSGKGLRTPEEERHWQLRQGSTWAAAPSVAVRPLVPARGCALSDEEPGVLSRAAVTSVGLSEARGTSASGRFVMPVRIYGSGSRLPCQGLLQSAHRQRAVLLAEVLLLLGLIACLMTRGSSSAKRYVHGTASTAVAALIGTLAAQSAVVLLSALGGPNNESLSVEVSLHVEFAVLAVIFAVGFFALSGIGWRCRYSSVNLLLVRTVGAHLVGFFGVYVFDAVWKEIALSLELYSQRALLWAAGGTLCAALTASIVCARVAWGLRTRFCETELSDEPEPKEVHRRIHYCGVRLCRAFGTGAPCVGLPPSNDIKHRGCFEEDVLWAENVAISLVMTLFIYKALVLLIAGLSLGMLLSIVFFAMAAMSMSLCAQQCKSDDSDESRTRHVLAAIAAQLLGVGVVGGVSSLIERELGATETTLFIQLVVALALSVLALAALATLGVEGCRTERSYSPLTPEQLKYPQAHAGLGLMLAMAWSNAVTFALGLAARSSPVLSANTTLSWVTLAALVAACMFFTLKWFADPCLEIGPAHDAHQRVILAEGRF